METSENAAAPRRRVRTIATVSSLDQLVGGHPGALRDLYYSCEPADPSALGERAGRVLAIESLAAAHLALRPLIVAAARHLSPWSGKVFETGGTAGTDLVLGRPRFRFQSEIAPSRFDGEPALVLRYRELGNPWPVRHMTAELRTVAGGVHLGATFWRDEVEPLLWWGLEPVS